MAAIYPFRTELLQIRSMTDQDLPAVIDIEQRAYMFPWSEGIFRDCLRVGYSCWVGDYGGAVEAYGIMMLGSGESHILNLCVHPASQGYGIGRSILNHMLAVASWRQSRVLLLEVRPSNTAALKLYRNLGFTQVGVRKGYYPAFNGKEDALVLMRRLVPDPFTGA